MTRPRYAEVVSRLVRRVRLEAPPSLPSDRRRLVGAVEQALRARARRRARGRTAGIMAVGIVMMSAAAALVLVVGGRGLWVRSKAPAGLATTPHRQRELTVLAAGEGHADAVAVAVAVVKGDAKRVPLRRGMTVAAGIRLVAPETGEVRVGTAEGTALTLEPGSDLTVAEASTTQRFALHGGAVRAQVARLFAGDRFLINTDDAEVEVHGTVFRVAVVAAEPSCGDGSTTRVSVSEGVVTVRAGGQEARVLPGGEWPAGCATAEPYARRVARHPSFRVAGTGAAAAQSAMAAPVPATAPQSSSALAAQNDLFAAAVRARNQGRPADGVRLFDKLVDAYPGSPLVESALVQRMKLLASAAPAAGVRAAADYLERFPTGFARADAKRLLDRAPE
jgi:hypothetical protein